MVLVAGHADGAIGRDDLAFTVGAIVAHQLELEASRGLVVTDHFDQVRPLLITEEEAILDMRSGRPVVGDRRDHARVAKEIRRGRRSLQ